MFKQSLMIFAIIGVAASANAQTIVCKQTQNSTTNTVVFGPGVFMACQSPSTINLNEAGAKQKYCAGASFLVTDSGNSSDGSTQIAGQTLDSALNSMTKGVSVRLALKSGKARVSLSNGKLSPIGINLPTQADYSCTIK